jgi:pimeloyl-ACP methyl ester carboxylesterase
VFLHEGLGSVSMWKDFPDEVAARIGCGALVYSRYGNGESGVLREARAVSYMHDEALHALPELLEERGIDDAILIGHSDGASIALIYTGEIGTRVRAIVAEAPHVFVEDVSVRSIAAAKTAYENGDLKARLARYHRDVDRTFYGWNDIWLHPDFRAWNILEPVKKIRTPMLLVQGENDEYGTLAQLDALRAHAKNSAVDSLVLAKCGHSPHRDRREATVAAIATFVASNVER